MTIDSRYTEASTKTLTYLQSIIENCEDVAPLPLPEIDQVVEMVARVAPAGDVPGVILNGLLRLSDRQLPQENIRRDIGFLLRGVKNQLDRAVYGTFFAGPAAVIWAYQSLLRLAGKSPEDAFPEGPWQFYVDYALREDTARHTNETNGFDQQLTQYELTVDPVDRLTAWVMSAIHTLHQYDDLLINEWRERVYCYTLRELVQDGPYCARIQSMYRDWERIRPFRRGQDVRPNESYARYRRRKFDHFLESRITQLPGDIQKAWINRIRLANQAERDAYVKQMSIQAYLEPSMHEESRIPLSLEEMHVGVIHDGAYYLIPICESGTQQPVDVEIVRSQIAAILTTDPQQPAQLAALARVRRATIPELRKRLSPSIIAAWNQLRSAPILINSDGRSSSATLAQIRQTERGVGDHPLTLIDTGHTMVFDQSHIFFDGAWGAACAEIMTNEAVAWGVYLDGINTAGKKAAHKNGPKAITFNWTPFERQWIEQAPHTRLESSAESSEINLRAIVGLRHLFKRRSDLIQLTVNDLLILYRAIHAALYQPNPDLIEALETLKQDPATAAAATSALKAIKNESHTNPAILIPIDATLRSPRDRIYPLCFEVPLQELDLLNLHKQVVKNLNTYGAIYSEGAAYERFDSMQRRYLATLAGFGQLFDAARSVGTKGESASVGSIKLLAYMPTSWQRMLDRISGKFDLLNDLIKGQEVVSNLGAVVASSSLTRFITAKDDNDKKTLTWGVLTDSAGVMKISLRDFRDHVQQLNEVGYPELADWIVQDYLNAYVHGLNDYIRDLRRITVASRDSYPEGERTLLSL